MRASSLMVIWAAAVAAVGLIAPQPASASRWEIRKEVREGYREVERERREARREIRREIREDYYDRHYRGDERWYVAIAVANSED